MTRAVYPSEIEEELGFARQAAQHFAKHPEHTTYTSGDIKPGCLFGIRWGLGEDCVMVIKLDESHVPTNYMEIVRQFKELA